MRKSRQKATGLAPIGGDPTWRLLRKRHYRVRELMALTGMTRKKVEYWAAIGLLTPSMQDHNASGSQPGSSYSAAAVLKALILCDLRQRGFTPNQLKQVSRNLESHGRLLGDSELYLLSDGYSVFYYATSEKRVIDILKHHRQMLLVPIHEQIQKLKRVA